MSKEYLEAFETIYNNIDYLISDIVIEEDEVNGCLMTIKEQLPIIIQALQRLKSIDNANPSEALECLEDIYRNAVFISDYDVFGKQHPTNISPETNKSISVQCDAIKQALLKAQEPKQYVDELKLVEKKLKALEIIKEKNVNIKLLKASSDVEHYNNEVIRVLGRWFAEMEFLTEEEFNLLKEVLE